MCVPQPVEECPFCLLLLVVATGPTRGGGRMNSNKFGIVLRSAHLPSHVEAFSHSGVSNPEQTRWENNLKYCSLQAHCRARLRL